LGGVRRLLVPAVLICSVGVALGSVGAGSPAGSVDRGADADRTARRGVLAQPLDAVKPEILGTCSPAVHDRFVALGPDGRRYRTWHPQVVPLDAANPGGPNCRFAHEHGDDPSTSLADPTPPLFGYLAAMHGMEEPHEGFKVFVINRGTTNDEGRTATTSTRVMAHMGTGGPRRFTLRHHTLEFDLVSPTGHEVHVQGMADTGLAGSICQRDRSLSDTDRSNDVGRTFVVAPGAGCDAGGSLYEIWQFTLDVGAATVIASTAVFDPITVLTPSNTATAVPTVTAYPRFGAQQGCDRESYHGPVYWYRGTGPNRFFTDVMGNPLPPDAAAGTAVEQWVSNHTDIGIPMNHDQSQMKLRSAHCAVGFLGPFN
jgi:hypothetical protein